MNTYKKRVPLLKNVPVPAVLDNDNLPPEFQDIKTQFLKEVKRDFADTLPPGITEVEVVFTKFDYRVIFQCDLKAPDLIAYASTKLPKNKGREAFVVTTDKDTGELILCFLEFPTVPATKGFWLNDRLAIKACIYQMRAQIAHCAPGTPYRLEIQSLSQDSAKGITLKAFGCEGLPGYVVTEWTSPIETRWTLIREGKRPVILRTFNPAEGR